MNKKHWFWIFLVLEIILFLGIFLDLVPRQLVVLASVLLAIYITRFAKQTDDKYVKRAFRIFLGVVITIAVITTAILLLALPFPG